MALGETYIVNIENLQSEITNEKNQIEDCWNTFQFVAKNMDDWAGNANIGAEVKEQCVKLSNELENSINNLGNLLKKISVFLQNQREINNRKV